MLKFQRKEKIAKFLLKIKTFFILDKRGENVYYRIDKTNFGIGEDYGQIQK